MVLIKQYLKGNHLQFLSYQYLDSKVFPTFFSVSYLEDYEKVHFFGDDETNPLNRNFGGYRRFRYTISGKIEWIYSMCKNSMANIKVTNTFLINK